MKARNSIKKEFDLSYSEKVSPFYKSYENKIQMLYVKFKDFLYYGAKKIVVTLSLFAVFSWFNIHNTNFIQGIASLISGDLAGISLIFDYKSNVGTLKEAWQVGVGVDYSWLDYKKETGKDLHGKFTYVGKKASVMKDVVLIGDFTEDCSSVCEDVATAVTREESNEFCEETYGARLLNKSEYERIIGSINPVVDPKLNKRPKTPEWTSNLNPNDGDDYYVYFKSSKKPESFINESYNKEGIYLDEDADYNINIGFRCIIELPY